MAKGEFLKHTAQNIGGLRREVICLQIISAFTHLDEGRDCIIYSQNAWRRPSSTVG